MTGGMKKMVLYFCIFFLKFHLLNSMSIQQYSISFSFKKCELPLRWLEMCKAKNSSFKKVSTPALECLFFSF